MQYPHLLQCTATRWRFRFNKKGKAYAGWYKYFYATLWVSLECSKPDVVQARPGQARAGKDRRGQAMPKPQRANKATTVDTLAEHWDQPAACISQCGCLYVCIRIQVCTYTYVRSRASILPSCCSKSHNVDGHSLWFGRANTAHAAAVAAAVEPLVLSFPLFFVPGKATLTSCHLMSHIPTYIYTVCVGYA